jgi:hypothetical protein
LQVPIGITVTGNYRQCNQKEETMFASRRSFLVRASSIITASLLPHVSAYACGTQNPLNANPTARAKAVLHEQADDYWRLNLEIPDPQLLIEHMNGTH